MRRIFDLALVDEERFDITPIAQAEQAGFDLESGRLSVPPD
jgi:hypothetical protein